VDSSQVLSALARVDKVYQAAVALFYLEDCSYKEIAAILDVAVGTVKSRIARGIAQLRGFLLSDVSRASSSSEGGTLSTFRVDKLAAPSTNTPSPSVGCRAQLVARAFERRCDEWGLRSSLLRKQLRPA
jgi:hypothetical protein